MNDVEVDNILMEIKILQNERNCIDIKLCSLQSKLLEICKHPNPVKKKRYEEGSYF